MSNSLSVKVPPLVMIYGVLQQAEWLKIVLAVKCTWLCPEVNVNPLSV